VNLFNEDFSKTVAERVRSLEKTGKQLPRVPAPDRDRYGPAMAKGLQPFAISLEGMVEVSAL